MFVPKLMAFDLDGTLAQSKQRLSADMADLLEQLLLTMPVAIMSGASMEQFELQLLPAFSRQAKLGRLYLFPTNAAQCFVHRGGTWESTYDHSFSKTEREVIVEVIQECIQMSHFKIPEKLWGPEIEDRGAEISFSALGQQAPVEEKEKWHTYHEVERKKLYETLAKKLPGLSIAEGGLTTIDITRRGINKAYGVRKLPSLTGITIPEMLYVGDALEEGGNDSVVKETGVKTHAVFGVEETTKLIEEILKNKTLLR